VNFRRAGHLLAFFDKEMLHVYFMVPQKFYGGELAD